MDIRLDSVELREAFFIEVYQKSFPAVARHVAKMGGSVEEAQDIFQDALVAYYEKIVSGNQSIANGHAYIFGIAKNLWLQQYKNGSKNSLLQSQGSFVENEETPSTEKVLHYLATAGKKFMELLKAYYYDHMSVENVVSAFGYSGKRPATVAKYKCLEKVRETVKQKSLDYADFIE